MGLVSNLFEFQSNKIQLDPRGVGDTRWSGLTWTECRNGSSSRTACPKTTSAPGWKWAAWHVTSPYQASPAQTTYGTWRQLSAQSRALRNKHQLKHVVSIRIRKLSASSNRNVTGHHWSRTIGTKWTSELVIALQTRCPIDRKSCPSHTGAPDVGMYPVAFSSKSA